MAYILVVDDDEDFTNVASVVLGSEGHEVEVALDIDTATNSMNQRKPDLVVLDVMFPEDNNAGFELARTIKGPSGAFKDVPILMLTAVNEKSPVKFSSGDIDEAWLPVSDFLEKPVDLDVLKNRVRALLEAAGAPKES
jgi:DNA-binding response OmpR family regulator